MRQRVASIERKMLGEGEKYAFARAASPLHLTDLGRATSLSGFSPKSAVAILDFLPTIDEDLSPIELFTLLLTNLAGLPEQRDERWRKKVTNPRTKLLIATRDLPDVLRRWLDGVSYPEIFSSLPGAIRSSRGSRVGEWISGRTASEDWSDEYDKFLDFVMNVLEQYLPWLLFGCKLLAPYAHSVSTVNWSALQVTLEERVERAKNRSSQSRSA